MDDPIDDAVADVMVALGQRLRAARNRRGLTLATVEERTGISRSTQSRLELGGGASTPIGTWIVLSKAIGIELLAPPPDASVRYRAALAGLVRAAGWEVVHEAGGTLWLDRPTAPIPGLRSRQRPHERAVVRVVPTLTDVAAEDRALRRSVEDATCVAPPGQLTQGVLVVVRTTDAVRRGARRGLRLSDQSWLAALQRPAASMPRYRGWVWLEPGGRHLLPWGG